MPISRYFCRWTAQERPPCICSNRKVVLAARNGIRIREERPISYNEGFVVASRLGTDIDDVADNSFVRAGIPRDRDVGARGKGL